MRKLPYRCGAFESMYTSLKTMERTGLACRLLRPTMASIIRLGVHSAIINLIVCARIVKPFSYSKAIYDCELWGKITTTERLLLGIFHHFSYKNM